MNYWVYENTIHKKARIHAASCSFCGDGKGIHGGGKTVSGIWHGPFDNIDDANAAALSTKQSDIRGCNLCVANAVLVAPTIAEATKAKTIIEVTSPTDWDRGRELSCSLSLEWSPKGPLRLDENHRVVFPDVEAAAGLYRFAAKYPDGRLALYIGESDNLRRRFGNYRNPGPTQQTSLRINSWLKELTGDGGEVSVSVAERLQLNGQVPDISRKAVRRMFEQMAIVHEHAVDVESLNR